MLIKEGITWFRPNIVKAEWRHAAGNTPNPKRDKAFFLFLFFYISLSFYVCFSFSFNFYLFLSIIIHHGVSFLSICLSVLVPCIFSTFCLPSKGVKVWERKRKKERRKKRKRRKCEGANLFRESCVTCDWLVCDSVISYDNQSARSSGTDANIKGR